ncbi:MAG: ATP-binding cassette domain-containing protein [Chryseolinea sp.]
MYLGPIAITIQDLGKKFNTEWIFRGMSGTFEPGNIYAITGPNGGGKSTLLQVLWGQVPPSHGTLIYKAGTTVVPHDDVYKYLSIATPYMDLIEEFTLEEQVKFHFNLKKARDGLKQSEMIERMYLGNARSKYISNFSSGMRQRVKLALAFYTESSIVFLDEPSTNLDSKAFEWYQSELSRLPAQCLVFIASNQSSEYPSNAQKIDIMSYK